MKLTEKDKSFLESLMESKDLWVELKPGRPSYMVLKGTYGEKIHKTFRMTRQGVRWRFQRLFNHVYVEALSTILMIEKTFGTQLRYYAVTISREGYELRREIQRSGFRSASGVVKNYGYTFELHFWKLRLTVFIWFHLICRLVNIAPGIEKAD